MIIWLNGPFGGGKTTVTRELLAAWPDLLLFDPEFLGGPAAHYSPERATDWQELPLWRHLTVAAADGLLRAYGRPLVVPMTLLREDYAVEIFDRLDVLSWPVFHLVLDAPAEVLRARVDGSDEGGPDSAGIAAVRNWRLDHLPAYEQALTNWLADAGTVLPTAGRAPKQVAEDILAIVRDDGES
jgi:hypothetical protein